MGYRSRNVAAPPAADTGSVTDGLTIRAGAVPLFRLDEAGVYRGEHGVSRLSVEGHLARAAGVPVGHRLPPVTKM